MSNELYRIINRSLRIFTNSIFKNGWEGREREAISYYAFNFLQKERRQKSVYYSPAQIGIETAVPGISGLNSKKYVNKDLVIWRKGGMNAWNSSDNNETDILAIMEWKVYRNSPKIFLVSKKDANWLKSFIINRRITISYAVAIDLKKECCKCIVTRFRNGEVKEEHFEL